MTAKVTENEPIDSYHGDKNWFSRSQLWDLVAKGPTVFHARHILGRMPGAFVNSSMEWGSMIHEWAETGPDWFKRVVLIPPSVLGKDGRRVKETSAWEAEQREKRPDAVFMKDDEFKALVDQTEMIMANPIFEELSSQTTHREISVRWRDPETNLPLKCRPDSLGRIVWDIKTTKEQQPLENFWKSVVDFGYDFQVEHYLAGLREAGFQVEKFVFLVTSTVPPYSCHAVTLPEGMLSRARKTLRRALNEVRDRIELDHWDPVDAGQVTELYIPDRFLEKEYGSRQSYRLPRIN